MEVVKIPKKLKDICTIIRAGNISDGLEELNKFNKLETQKNAIKAEIAYFSFDFEKAMTLDRKVFPHWSEWYSSNIFQEHLVAFTFAALQSSACVETTSFYKAFLEDKLKEEGLKPHQQDYFSSQILKNIDILTNGLERYRKENEFTQSNSCKSISEFTVQVKKNRPKFKENSLEATDYMLNFIYTDGFAKDFIELYEKFSQTRNFNSNHHICAAKIYVSLNKDDNAREAISNYVRFGWNPVEHTKVMPLTLFLEYSLYKLLTMDFLKELMLVPKG